MRSSSSTLPKSTTTIISDQSSSPMNNVLTTTITSDPGILCFHHCTVKVFCFNLPNICPNCHSQLDTDSPDASDCNNSSNEDAASPRSALQSSVLSKLLPFRLPYPFIKASQYPCAIVLRPTTGDFLNDYNNATDLHIAVTTSHGSIVEFDRNGLQRRRSEQMSEWWQCLLVGDVPEPWYDLWDNVLIQISKHGPHRWTIDHYDEDAYNCYTFVLTFLQALGYDKLSEAARSKTEFCEKFIVPRTTTAGKYISLYRKLRDTGVYVHQVNPKHKESVLQLVTAAADARSSLSNNVITNGQTKLCTIEE